MIRESSAHGDRTWKDVLGSHYLIPGEEPRKAYPFPADHTCPHCGRRNGNVRSETFFRCWTCGQLIERYVESVQPVTRELISHFLDGLPYEEVTCKTCSKRFIKKLKADYESCGTCRCIKANEDYRARKRAMKDATKGAPAPTPGKEDSCEDFSTVEPGAVSEGGSREFNGRTL